MCCSTICAGWVTHYLWQMPGDNHVESAIRLNQLRTSQSTYSPVVRTCTSIKHVPAFVTHASFSLHYLKYQLGIVANPNQLCLRLIRKLSRDVTTQNQVDTSQNPGPGICWPLGNTGSRYSMQSYFLRRYRTCDQSFISSLKFEVFTGESRPSHHFTACLLPFLDNSGIIWKEHCSTVFGFISTVLSYISRPWDLFPGFYGYIWTAALEKVSLRSTFCKIVTDNDTDSSSVVLGLHYRRGWRQGCAVY